LECGCLDAAFSNAFIFSNRRGKLRPCRSTPRLICKKSLLYQSPYDFQKSRGDLINVLPFSFSQFVYEISDLHIAVALHHELNRFIINISERG
jgi:hypothetical protein